MADKLPHIAVLMGGQSAERDVSLMTGNAVKDALLFEGYKTTTIDACSDLPRKIQKVRKLQYFQPRI